MNSINSKRNYSAVFFFSFVSFFFSFPLLNGITHIQATSVLNMILMFALLSCHSCETGWKDLIGVHWRRRLSGSLSHYIVCFSSLFYFFFVRRMTGKEKRKMILRFSFMMRVYFARNQLWSMSATIQFSFLRSLLLFIISSSGKRTSGAEEERKWDMKREKKNVAIVSLLRYLSSLCLVVQCNSFK